MSWEISEKLEKRLVRIWQKLKDTDFNISPEDAPYTCSFEIESKNFRWLCTDCKIVFFDGKIMRVRRDSHSVFENTLLKTAPDDIFSDICYFLNNP